MKNFIQIPARIKKIDTNHPRFNSYLSDDVEQILVSTAKIIKVKPVDENNCVVYVDEGTHPDVINCKMNFSEILKLIESSH